MGAVLTRGPFKTLLFSLEMPAAATKVENTKTWLAPFVAAAGYKRVLKDPLETKFCKYKSLIARRTANAPRATIGSPDHRRKTSARGAFTTRPSIKATVKLSIRTEKQVPTTHSILAY